MKYLLSPFVGAAFFAAVYGVWFAWSAGWRWLLTGVGLNTSDLTLGEHGFFGIGIVLLLIVVTVFGFVIIGEFRSSPKDLTPDHPKLRNE